MRYNVSELEFHRALCLKNQLRTRFILLTTGRNDGALWNSGGKIEEEGSALTDGALNGDAAFVSLDDLPDDEKTKPRSLARLFRREERIVDFIQFIRGNPGACVLHLDHHSLSLNYMLILAVTSFSVTYFVIARS